MRKAYSVIITVIALVEFIFILHTGGLSILSKSPPAATVRPYRAATSAPAAARSSTSRPTYAPTKAPEQKYNFVAFTRTRVFHIPTCELLDQLTEPNKEYIEGTPEALIMLGYTPCSYCKADSFDVYSAFKVTDSSKSQSAPAFSFPAWAASVSKPTAQPRTAATPKPAITFIANTSTGKFHKPSCASVKQMYNSHKKEFYCTRQEMISMGYSPCQRCHP